MSGGYRAQARREAKSLAAEWIDAWLCTDDGWREAYTEAEQALVREELERIRDRFEEAGPSAVLSAARGRTGGRHTPHLTSTFYRVK